VSAKNPETAQQSQAAMPSGTQTSTAPETQPCPSKDKIKVTPELKVEYKVVLFDRGLSAHQGTAETKLPTDPTYILCSLKQSKADPKFTQGATLKTEGTGKVEAYEDDKLTKKIDLAKPLPHDKLAGATPYKVFLKGTTKGKFDLKLEVEAPKDAQFEADKPAIEKMGVVEVRFTLHEQDQDELAKVQVDPDTDPVTKYHDNLKAKKLPDQKAMTDERKVKTGRLLHVQKDGHHGRAKLILHKIDPAEWPAGTDAYEIVLSACESADPAKASAALGLFDKEWEGTAQDFPLKVKVSALKAKDKVLWVEGKTASKKALDVQLTAGLDRAAGEPAKTPKGHGDWARFTVAEIKEVKLDAASLKAGAAAWDEAKGRLFINLKAGTDGRKVKILVALTEKIENVVVHAMLAPDKDNLKKANWGEDLPSKWKWKDIDAAVKHLDRKDRKDLLHLSGKTDADGKASVELTLSRLGGDKFLPGAYLGAADPHLARYVHGHADLEKKKPVFAAKAIQVWRKFWYQVVKVEGISPPAMTGAEGQYERVRTLMVKGTDIAVTRATVDGYNPKAIYPKYMIKVGGGDADALVVSDGNKGQFFSGYAAEADKPVKIPLLICDAQWDAGDESGSQDVSLRKASQFPVDVEMDKLVLDPPLQGGKLLAAGTWKAAEYDASTSSWENVRQGTLAAGDLTVSKTRDSLMKVTVKKPAGLTGVTADTYLEISGLKIKGAKGPYLGEYSSANKRILAVYDPDEQEDFQNTIAHEIGHALRQVSKAVPTGVPAHPYQYDKQGSHCKRKKDKCVMYESGPIAGSLNQYCDICHPYLLIQEMETWA